MADLNIVALNHNWRFDPGQTAGTKSNLLWQLTISLGHIGDKKEGLVAVAMANHVNIGTQGNQIGHVAPCAPNLAR
jgi:hypothetical protein